VTPADTSLRNEATDSFLPDCSVAVAFHAALLTRERRGVVIIGPSFAGKSTLATGLWMHGWTLLSDDVAFVDSSGIAHPLERRVSLRHGSRELVGESAWNSVKSAPSTTETFEGLLFHPHEVREPHHERSTPVAAFFFLSRREVVTEPGAISPLNAAESALALLPYAMNVRDLPFPAAVRAVAPLAESVPAFDLGRGSLSAMIEAVEQAIVR
jgi:hypothetical protein